MCDEPAEPQVECREKRKKSFFDAVYEPGDHAPFARSSWDFGSEPVRDHQVLDAVKFGTFWKERNKQVVYGITFNTCDFEGDFRQYTPSFKKCSFSKCDFSFSMWSRARFKGCSFYKTSLTLAELIHCEFRDCTFIDISLSGNETILSGTIFTNPQQLIQAAYTNRDEDVIRRNANGKNLAYQLMRLEGTKAVVSRTVMNSHFQTGDEAAYYEIVQTYQNISINAKLMEVRYKLSEKPAANVAPGLLIRLAILHIERLLVNSAGFVNNWGASIAKPTVIGGCIVVLFTLIYWAGGVKPTLFRSFVTSADITFLIGYTKHSSIRDLSRIQLLYAINMFVGLFWYSIFIATLIGRVSRVR